LIPLSKWKIRKYLPSDRKACRDLWVELVERHRQLYQDPSIGGANPEDYFDQHLAKIGAEKLWIASFGLRTIGFMGIEVDGDEVEIEPLIVSQPYRSKGVGKMLVQAAIAEAHKIGARKISVKPVARNIEAINFFFNQGFRNIGHIQLFISFQRQQWKEGLNLFDLRFSF